MIGKRRKVLVVDDEPSILRLVVDSMDAAEFEVLTAKDGVEALKLIDDARGAIDVLLIDVVMPRMHGSELARVVLSSHPTIKIIFMSGQQDEVIALHGIPASKMRYIKKPFTPAELMNAVIKELFR